MSGVAALYGDDAFITPRETRMLLGTMVVYAVHGRATIREAAMIAGVASSGDAHGILHRLRDRGLVGFDDNVRGSLRPTVAIVAGPWCTELLESRRASSP